MNNFHKKYPKLAKTITLSLCAFSLLFIAACFSVGVDYTKGTEANQYLPDYLSMSIAFIVCCCGVSFLNDEWKIAKNNEYFSPNVLGVIYVVGLVTEIAFLVAMIVYAVPGFSYCSKMTDVGGAICLVCFFALDGLYLKICGKAVWKLVKEYKKYKGGTT